MGCPSSRPQAHAPRPGNSSAAWGHNQSLKYTLLPLSLKVGSGRIGQDRAGSAQDRAGQAGHTHTRTHACVGGWRSSAVTPVKGSMTAPPFLQYHLGAEHTEALYLKQDKPPTHKCPSTYMLTSSQPCAQERASQQHPIPP